MSDEPLAFLNGRLLPQGQAVLPLHDAGFVFGATLTDLCRTFHHRLFRLADHLARFARSAEITGIAHPLPTGELARRAEELVEHNARLIRPEQELALVMFATPGPLGYYAGLPTIEAGPTLGLHTFPLPFARYASLFREGGRLRVPGIRQVPAASIAPHVKHRSRLHWWLAGREAQQVDPGAWALLLDSMGHVTETAAANFLLVQGSTVLSPPRDAVLNGVSLQVVEELCAELNIPFAERTLTLHDCETADEAMLCGTAFCLAGVSQINGTPLAFPGHTFLRLLHAWSQAVGLDIAGQFLADS